MTNTEMKRFPVDSPYLLIEGFLYGASSGAICCAIYFWLSQLNKPDSLPFYSGLRTIVISDISSLLVGAVIGLVVGGLCGLLLAAFIQSKKLRAFESRLVIHKTQEYDSQLQQTDSQRIRRWKNQRGEYSRI